MIPTPEVRIVRSLRSTGWRFAYVIVGWKRLIEPSGFRYKSEAAALKAGEELAESLVRWETERCNRAGK